MTDHAIARACDAAILKPDISRADCAAQIRACVARQVFSVCVRPSDIDLAVELTRGSATAVSAVIGFPHGTTLAAAKAAEAALCLELGAVELDMVANIARIRSADWAAVEADIRAVAQVCKPAGALLKVILETCLLSLDEVTAATRMAIAAGADFVKTSTGFNGPGASIEAVSAMLEAAAGRIQVKASGGIRSRDQAAAFLAMGVTRLGVGATALDAILGGTAEVRQSGY
jgi:deoxyribose-phosphate aldolase